jgi:cardiolipin synthase
MILAASAALHFIVQVGLIVRVLLRAHRDPGSRIAWVIVILSIPLVGIGAYLLFGETNIGRRHFERMRAVEREIRRDAKARREGSRRPSAAIPDRWTPLFNAGKSVNGFDPVGGNRAELMADSIQSIERMVEYIDGAK